MNNRERFIAAHFQSDFFVRQRFQLIREVENRLYNKKEGVWKEYVSVIEELAEGIERGKLTRYNLTDDYVKKRFGLGDDYFLTSLISELAFYQAGLDASKQNASPTMDYLNEIEENMEGGFFMGYQPAKEALSSLVNQLEGRALEVAAKSRDIERQEGALERFCQELDKIDSEDAIIKKINHYNDGSYMELWRAVYGLAHYLKKEELWDDYYRLLEYLIYFPLQGGLIKILNSSSDIEAIVEKIAEKNGRKSIQYLFREQWFKVECEEDVILKANGEIDELSDEDCAYIADLLENNKNSRQKRIEQMITIWTDVFGKEELSVWASDKKAEAERKHEKYGTPEKELLKLITDKINVTAEDVKGFNLKDKDFSSLLTFAGTTDDEKVATDVIEILVDKVFTERFYPSTVLNSTWFEQARTIYRCLDKSGKDGLKLMEVKRKPREGFKVDLGDAMHTERQEAYWLAVLLLALEAKDDKSQFDELIKILFRDTRYGIDSLTNDVFVPYYVAELLVTQVMTEKKDEYEEKLLIEIPYLVFVIRVLTGNNGVMSDKIRTLLTERIQNEWPLERKLLSQNKMVKIGFYDELVEKHLKRF